MTEKLKPVTITLEDEVDHDGKTYSEVIFARKMKGKDMLAADTVQGNQRKEFAIIASMAGLPFQVVAEMSVDDLEAVQEAAIPFMGKRAEARVAKIMAKMEQDASST